MREYNPTWGRWISPDPAGMAAANPADPQTWNRYAYVGNNPLSFIDPLGLYGCPDDPNNPWCIGVTSTGHKPKDAPPRGETGPNDAISDFMYYGQGCWINEGMFSIYTAGCYWLYSTSTISAPRSKTPIIQAAPPPPPPDSRPSCMTVFADALAGNSPPVGYVARQASQAGSEAASAQAYDVMLERGLVKPLASSTYRFWAYLGEDLATAAEVIPIAFATADVVQADWKTAKANYNGECRPVFP